MTTLHLDLSKSATRKSIFGQLVAATPDSLKGGVGVVVSDESIPEKSHFHNYMEVWDAIDTTIASEWTKEQAKQVYYILAQAEATVHGCEIEHTHFHEVGEGMTVREILGMCRAVELIAPEAITATKVQPGSGKVECAHGLLDIPAPATAAILERYHIPLLEERPEGELCTPTSAAFIAHFVKEFK